MWRPARRATCASSWRATRDRKSTRLNSSHTVISYAVFCLKKKNKAAHQQCLMRRRLQNSVSSDSSLKLVNERESAVLRNADHANTDAALRLFLSRRGTSVM